METPRFMKITLMTITAVLAALSAAPALADWVETRASGGEARQACAYWQSQAGTGEYAAVCVVQVDPVGFGTVNDSDPQAYVPYSLVAWWHSCGTAIDCIPYDYQSPLDRFDFQMSIDATSAILETTVGGCALEFSVTASSQDPLDGYSNRASIAIRQARPSGNVSVSRSRFLFASGTGQLCNDPLAEGSITVAGIWRWESVGAARQDYGTDKMPVLAPIATWKMEGTVTNTQGLPIAGATISSTTGVRVTTDSNGNYVFTEPMLAISEPFIVYAPGYEPESRIVTIIDQQNRVNFVLERDN